MRVSEVYASAQGEGPNVGKTTVFTRLGGCNLRCPGWPCDTQHAIDPAFRKEWIGHTPKELLERIKREADLSGARTVTLTGGEPFLQPASELEDLVLGIKVEGFDIDCFSNGTILYPRWATNNIRFIMDWKLPGSGEDAFNTTRFTNLSRLITSPLEQSVKFVVKDWTDFRQAKNLYWDHLEGRPIATYYGRVWESEITDAELVKAVMEDRLPWLLNRQEHNYIWPANERGR